MQAATAGDVWVCLSLTLRCPDHVKENSFTSCCWSSLSSELSCHHCRVAFLSWTGLHSAQSRQQPSSSSRGSVLMDRRARYSATALCGTCSDLLLRWHLMHAAGIARSCSAACPQCPGPTYLPREAVTEAVPVALVPPCAWV